MTKLQSKGIKALDLAISAEDIGSYDECKQAARTAGELAQRAGFDLDQVWRAVENMGQYSMTWTSVVDGWYDSAEAK